MKAKFRWAALTALLASTLGFAAVPVELAIDFAAETAAEWGKTKGTELKIDSGVLTLNGTNWDSKAFKSVILTPDLRYKLTGNRTRQSRRPAPCRLEQGVRPARPLGRCVPHRIDRIHDAGRKRQIHALDSGQFR